MNAKEKKILTEELDKYQAELEGWLVKWFRPSAKAIRDTLSEKANDFRETLNSKLKIK